ncbi:MAG TPA: pyridoxal phosphate-dependent aminotransferase [Caulobacteraceae bacterium]|jgi:hypothetical protein|nr:pyridoxal phosphate-dependent aminotransferase [Caulobacteraceae bacterium]
MSAGARTMGSAYMAFAKLETAARFNLANSGVKDCSLDDLGASWADLALHGPNAYGYGPLVERIASRHGVPEACVVTPGGGCSFANHLAFSALVEPGDEVLVEDPTYELLTSALGQVGARLRTFERRAQNDWRAEPEAIAAAMTPRTRLIVLSHLHNPTGAPMPDADVAQIASLAERAGAWVLIDEVYREATFADGAPRTAFDPDGPIVTTSSLTKGYGLSGLRCGWILAPAPLAERMRRLNDLFGVAAPHVAERLAVVAFDHLPQLRARAQAILTANRGAYEELLAHHAALDQKVFPTATTVFPRLRTGDVDAFAGRLMREAETCITPGHFFNRPDHFRISLGGDPATTREGLRRLAAALG